MMTTAQIKNNCIDEKYFDMALSGKAVQLGNEKKQNFVLLSEEEFKDLEKARNNMAYLEKLWKAEEDIREGRVVVKTMAELEAMEK